MLLFLFTLGQLKAEKVQWATEIIGFSSELDSVQFSAKQVLGKPSVMSDFGFSQCAWASEKISNPEGEWIEVGFAEAMQITQIALNQNYNPGAISKIWLYDTSGTEYLVYQDPEPQVTSVKGKMLNVFIKKTAYLVKALKIKVETSIFDDWNQIDAIAISDSKDTIKPKVNLLPQIRERYYIENLGENVNSSVSELVPVIAPDGKTIYFTRNNHPDNTGPAKNLDVWYSIINENDSFEPAKNIGQPINNEHFNFLFSVSPDNNSIYLGNVYNEDGSMGVGVSKSQWDGENWSKPIALKIRNFVSLGGFATYYMAPSGKELYLSLAGKNSYGGMDIHVSFLLDDDTWSEPLNLGPAINTAADEIAPFIAADEKTLYFSTSGLPGFGANDIFFTQRLDTTWQNWSEPINLGHPVNTYGWEAYWSLPARGNYGYYVTNLNTYGQEDIFRIKLLKSQQPGTVMLVYGRVLDAKTEEPVQANIIYETLPNGTEVGRARSNPSTGEYKIILPAGEKYGFLAIAENYVSINENLDLRDQQEFSEIERDLYLVPIEKGQIVRMNNIFFEFAKYDILEDSYIELNRVVRFLESNPKVRIRIDGHTDNIGTQQDNLLLSRRRAAAVADYFIGKGVARERVDTMGFGFSKPISTNDTDEGRAKNRRVEFVIVEK